MKKIIALFLCLVCVFIFTACEERKEKSNPPNTAYINITPNGEYVSVNERLVFKKGKDQTEVKFLLPQNMSKVITLEPQNILGIEVISVKQNDKYLPFSILGNSQNVLNVELDETNNDMLELELDYKVKFKDKGFLYFLAVLPCIKQEELNFNYSEEEPLVLNEPFDFYFNSDYELNLEKANNLYKKENAVDFCLFNFADFKKQELEVNNTKLEYYYKKDINPSETLLEIKNTFAFFEEKLGEYNGKVLQVVESDFSESFSGTCLIDTNQSRESFLNNIVRLIASQWFKKTLLTDSINEPYFAGGLIEYALVSYLSKTQKGFDKIVARYENNIEVFNKNAVTMNYPFKIDSSRKASEYLNEYDYMYNVFVKSFLNIVKIFEGKTNEEVLSYLKTYLENSKNKLQDYSSFLEQVKNIK